MQCPACPTVQLVMSERQGIEIDYCPQCRGVWLDRGELDKIIDRASAETAPAPAAPVAPAVQQQAVPPGYAPPPQGYPQQHRHQGHPDSYHDGYRYKKKKREGFLSNIFDFD